MDNLLVSALHSAAADSIAQPQIFVIAHASGILTVVADQRLQALAQFRGFSLATCQAPACNLPAAPAGDPADQNSDTMPHGSPKRALLFATTLSINCWRVSQFRWNSTSSFNPTGSRPFRNCRISSSAAPACVMLSAHHTMS